MRLLLALLLLLPSTGAPAQLAPQDFEPPTFTPGAPIDSHDGWTLLHGEAAPSTEAARTGTHSLRLSGRPAPAVTVHRALAASTGITFHHLWIKPVVESDTAPLSSLAINGAHLAFLRENSHGTVHALDATAPDNLWLKAPHRFPLQPGKRSAATWLSLTIRENPATATWDLYLDGTLMLANLALEPNPAPGLTLHGTTTSAPVFLDDFSSSATNPHFPDADSDGIDDTWETDRGYDPALDDRLLPSTADPTITRLAEYLAHSQTLWTQNHPNLLADTDGDGMTDAYETALGLNPNDPDDALRDDDDDGKNNLAEYLLGTNPFSPPLYEKTVLGTNGPGISTQAITMNRPGQILLQTYDYQNSSAPTWQLWQNGTTTTFDFPTDGSIPYAYPQFLNASGQIAGICYNSNWQSKLFLTSTTPGSFQLIDLPGGPNSYPSLSALADDGTLWGSYYDPYDYTQKHFLWKNGTLTDLSSHFNIVPYQYQNTNETDPVTGIQTQTYSYAYSYLTVVGISASGKVAGNYQYYSYSYQNTYNPATGESTYDYENDNHQSAFLWEDGTLTNLIGTVFPADSYVSLNAIGPAGHVIGNNHTQYPSDPFVYQDTLTVIPNPPGTYNSWYPNLVNDKGQAAGTAWTNDGYQLILFDGATTQVLGPADWLTHMNTRGEIIGQRPDATGAWCPFIHRRGHTYPLEKSLAKNSALILQSTIALGDNGHILVNAIETGLWKTLLLKPIPDTDGDGLPDTYEITIGHDPHDPADATFDHDGDTLDAAAEYRASTNPFNPDTDDDQMPDAWEVRHRLNPLDPADAPLDYDGDKVSNLAEYRQGTNPNGNFSITNAGTISADSLNSLLLNDNGQVAGIATTWTNGYRRKLFLWHGPGDHIDLLDTTTWSNETPQHLTNRGDILGSFWDNGQYRIRKWNTTGQSDLATTTSWLQLHGVSTDAAWWTEYSPEYATRHRHLDTGADLPLPAAPPWATSHNATALNRRGDFLLNTWGYNENGNYIQAPAIAKADGTHIRLTPPEISALLANNNGSLNPTHLNGTGQAIATYYSSNYYYQPPERWLIGEQSATKLPSSAPSGADTWPTALNDLGQILLQSYSANESYLHRSGQTIKINDLLPEDTGGFTLQSTIALNNRGDLLLQGTRQNQQTFLLLQPNNDTDNDGLPDDWEQQIIDANPNDTITTLAHVNPGDDFDNDGLSNLDEYTAGSNPADNSGDTGSSIDTDGDGIPNSQELAEGSDPNDPASHSGLLEFYVFTPLE